LVLLCLCCEDGALLAVEAWKEVAQFFLMYKVGFVKRSAVVVVV